MSQEKQTAVVICPGRGTYNKPELGVLGRQFSDKALLARFDQMRSAQGQETLTELDGAARYSVAKHTRGDNASALIYAATLGDFRAIDRNKIDVVAVTGNSMGWYSALACADALTAEGGFEVVNTMGTLMQDNMIGGQLVYPFLNADWHPDPARKAELMALIDRIDGTSATLTLSIDLGGMLVLAGDEAGLAAFEQAVPVVQERFPLRLANHAGFHSHLQAPVAAQGRARLGVDLFHQPGLPMIDGRGHIWWPGACDTHALWDYTLGHQVTETYDFTHAIAQAAREFAPDLFIVTGPGTTLGGAVAQSLILSNWDGLGDKAAFQSVQRTAPFLVSMGMDDQRAQVT
ncbi:MULTISPECIES: ACP S-malonyltransferase [unclassified Ruegeria]|uniref:ACP S-malonyltransferase n=1 Tax=unclassified Ruegeria TaxID=2625375 RepID=UPI0014890F7C|nr:MULTISPECIES: ACP S-malonyltransferase [unclassified Ruegeria]NOD36840.1 ACP S-malonyltransferase [Ruegeria sp. HKCCD7296]NOD49836.1 ACP S-malonyltransferase [Ruegeria sp. HKCCD5849]NOD54196.1 ACP S-malonyltransferase [Ruegeria sp. HKCCD5851]NOD70167.1 ACP S-malonyltransferase [Ruegeria sp. HKCCD7303]NOE43999.1 ACP S-malonyltransferase [Ruegeria sp. HKCCD7319]